MEIKIGDRIVGKKTGAMIPSTVVGIMTYEWYIKLILQAENYDFPSWEVHYPNYKENLVIISEYDEYQNPYQYSEYYDRIINVMSPKLKELLVTEAAINEWIKHLHDTESKVKTVSFTIDDVELL